MQNYKELYLKMFRACEEAINLLVTAQQACEELYSSSLERECQIIPLPSKNKKE